MDFFDFRTDFNYGLIDGSYANIGQNLSNAQTPQNPMGGQPLVNDIGNGLDAQGSTTVGGQNSPTPAARNGAGGSGPGLSQNCMTTAQLVANLGTALAGAVVGAAQGIGTPGEIVCGTSDCPCDDNLRRPSGPADAPDTSYQSALM